MNGKYREIEEKKEQIERFQGNANIACFFGALGMIFLAIGAYILWQRPVCSANAFLGMLMMGWFAVSWLIFGAYVTVNGFETATIYVVECPMIQKKIKSHWGNFSCWNSLHEKCPYYRGNGYTKDCATVKCTFRKPTEEEQKVLKNIPKLKKVLQTELEEMGGNPEVN